MENCALTGAYTPAQRARFYDASGKRRAVRTFIDEPNVAQKSALHYAATRVCLPGVRIELSACEDKKLFRTLPFVDTIMGCTQYAALIAREDVPHAALYAGISGEAFILEAVSLGLGSCWVEGSYRKNAVDIPLNENEKLLSVIALGVPAQEEAVERKRRNLNEICTSKPENWPLWAYNAAECVRIAPSAMNRQPWRISYAGRTLQLSRKGFAPDLDMGIALLHLSLGVQEKVHVIQLGQGREVATLVAENKE